MIFESLNAMYLNSLQEMYSIKILHITSLSCHHQILHPSALLRPILCNDLIAIKGRPSTRRSSGTIRQSSRSMRSLHPSRLSGQLRIHKTDVLTRHFRLFKCNGQKSTYKLAEPKIRTYHPLSSHRISRYILCLLRVFETQL